MPELADFEPTDGHLHACTANDVRPCEEGCAGWLYVIAQDAERNIAAALALCDEWARLTKGPTPTTKRIRAALTQETR
jgi:hypothetical protein